MQLEHANPSHVLPITLRRVLPITFRRVLSTTVQHTQIDYTTLDIRKTHVDQFTFLKRCYAYLPTVHSGAIVCILMDAKMFP